VELNKQLTADVTAGLELGFALGGVGALVVGLFLVYNALSVSVAERRHDIGILRSVGATRGQIAGLFVGEAALLGLVGSLLALPVGYALAWVASKPMASMLSDQFVYATKMPVEVTPRLMLLAVLSGVAVAVLAALIPALRAAREEPADAVRRVPRVHGIAYLVVAAGVVVLLLTVGSLAVAFSPQLPRRAGVVVGFASIFVDVLLLTPLMAALVGGVVQPLFRHFLGLEGRLAADNLVRSPLRTGIVVAAVAATSGLMVQTAGVLKSTEEAVYQWVEEKIAADLYVSSGALVTSAGQVVPLDGKMREELKAMPGVEAVLPIRYHRVDLENHSIYLVALDADAFDKGAKNQPMAQGLARYPEFRQPGKVLVSENFAALHKVKKGDFYLVRGKGGKELRLEVIGTVVDYTWNRGTILMDRAWFVKEFEDSQVDIYDLFLAPGVDARAVRREIEAKWRDKDAVFVMTRAEIHKEVSSQLQRVYALAYAQQLVVGLVALLGVVTALSISVMQRRRELGLLRAVGATRPQVLRSVLAEAILMGLVGATIGFAIGLGLEWYVINLALLDEAGMTFPMRIPWVEAGAVSLLSVLMATVAGLWPAYHATRLRIPEAIAYE
jgi:putative ABC transport system permease protein